VAALEDGSEGVALLLEAGGRVDLGRPDQARRKLASAAAVIEAVTAACVERLDVTLPSSPALVRAPGCY
jgi:hypothetical protein